MADTLRRIELLERYGPWCLITGASSGIGLAYAKMLAEIGFNCIIVSNDEKQLLKVKTDIEQNSGRIVIPIVIDLGLEHSADFVFDKAKEYDVGLIINNVGYGIMGYFIQHPVENYLNMIRVNEEAAIILMHRFCYHFYKETRKSAIITVTSANAELLRGIPYSAVYSAGKSMLKNITEALYYEMKPFGIDILNVAPGPTNTNFQDVASTNRLFFMESPQNVVNKTFKTLGKRPNVITNPVTKFLVWMMLYIPASKKVKFKIRGWFFSSVLGKKENCKLP